MTERPDPYAWPEHTAASLLAGLAATRKADEAERFARLLNDGLCIECGDHRGWRVEPDWNTGEAVQVQCRACYEHVCPTEDGAA